MTATGVTATGVTRDATGVTSDLQGHCNLQECSKVPRNVERSRERTIIAPFPIPCTVVYNMGL